MYTVFNILGETINKYSLFPDISLYENEIGIIQQGEKDLFVLSFSHLSFVVSDEFVKDGLYSVYPNKFVSALGLHYLCLLLYEW